MRTLDFALTFIRSIQADCMNSGYYIALGGGVLNNGFSNNDLDLVLMPRTSESKTANLLHIINCYPLFVDYIETFDVFEHWNCRYVRCNTFDLKIEISIPIIKQKDL